jgi:Cu(I)-responsive transcriptional regulator
MSPLGHNIGAAARLSGVKVPTIRYYEQIGLLPPPPRTQGNRRLYEEGEISRLKFIRHARDLGFEVEDIRGLLAINATPSRSCAEADAIARHHLAAVERRIAQLQALREELQHMVTECGHGRVADCRVIQILADHGECQHAEHAPAEHRL